LGARGRAGGAYDSHHRTAGIAGRIRRCGCGVATGGARAAGRAGAADRLGWVGRSAGISPQLAGFHQGLKDFGYIEGQNVIVEYRFAEGRRDRIADLVAELVQMRPDVLVGLGNPVITALKNATIAIPIVFMTGDPVAVGYVASVARPGGNMTGVSMMQG